MHARSQSFDIEAFVQLRSIVILATSTFCAALVGCATSRSEIKLDAPAAEVSGRSTAAPVAPKGVAAIRTVKDERVFEQAPDDPSTPSLGFEGAAQATAATKLRAIGRKRNTYGKALGDVLLQGDATVESVMRKALTDAFRRSGYEVVDATAAPKTALLVDMHVKDFWAWMNPGFWAITINTRIVTDIDIAGNAPGGLRVRVHHQESRQFATDDTWIEVGQQALQLWRDEAVKKLQTLAPSR